MLVVCSPLTAALQTAVIKALKNGEELIWESSKLAWKEKPISWKRFIHLNYGFAELLDQYKRDSWISLTSTQSKICSSLAMSSSRRCSNCLKSSSGLRLGLAVAGDTGETSDTVNSNFWKKRKRTRLVDLCSRAHFFRNVLEVVLT